MMRALRTFSIASALMGAGLATAGLAQTVAVTAQGETAPVGTANADAADDPAIWRNPSRPEESLIVATDKKAGLHVYGLDGKVKSFTPAGRLNNVDIIDLGRQGILVAASGRNDETQARLGIYRLDPRSATLTPLGSVKGGEGEAYGVCLLRQRGRLYAFSVLKQGVVHQIRLDLMDARATGEIVRTMRLATQAEGCVADARTHRLYVGEEDRGIWIFDTRANRPVEGQLAASVDGTQLVADVEGLALAPSGRRGGYLVASSQGDNAYAVYRLPGMEPAGRFRIAAGRLGSTEETDGIALALGQFGPGYPGGMFVAQDGDNKPSAQNFKLVSWREILKAIHTAGRIRRP